MSSNLSNIKNSIYNFNFSLSKITGKSETNVFIPLPKGIIRHLEIDDNLANVGYVGSVIFNNFYGILDKLGLGSGISDSTTLFNIGIENKDFNGTNIQDNSIDTIVILQNNTDPSNNSIDKSIIYNFEEYSVNLLRQKKLEPSEVTGKITDSIYNLLKKCFASERIIEKNSFEALNSSSNEMSVGKSVLKTNSYYDFLKVLYKFLLLVGKNNSPGILQLENYIDENDTNKVIRKFTIRPLFDKMRSLIEKMRVNDTTLKNLKEEVLEEFTIGGESDQVTYRENSIESVTVLRPDFKSLYEDKWLNYTGVATLQNLTDVISIDIKYNDLRESFQRDALADSISNLPTRIDITDTDTLEKVLAFDYPITTDQNLLVEGITSMLYKSFIYDNTAVVFKTLGNPYRKPGSFIKLNGGKQVDKNSSVNGFWFIIGVKHIFENDIYSNEITAVKIFIQDEKGAIVSSSPAAPSTSTTSSVTPPATTNTSNFVAPNTPSTNINQSSTGGSQLPNTGSQVPTDSTQLPTGSETSSDDSSVNLLPNISTGEPVVNEESVTPPRRTNTTIEKESDFRVPGKVTQPPLPSDSSPGYDSTSDSLFPTPEGAPFAPDDVQTGNGVATSLGLVPPNSPAGLRIEQARKESLFNIVKVGGVDPAASARIADQRARRNAILGRS